MQFSPLRYPGGKGKLAPFIKQVLHHNRLCDCTYVEPYTGGGGVALCLLLEGVVWRIVINDIDPLVYRFWKSVLDDPDGLAKIIYDTPVSMDTWYKQKEILSRYEDYSDLQVGFATFFLNRTNRSGILHAGVIGGKSQNGQFKIDARFNKSDLVSRIKLIQKYRGRISLYNVDAMELLNIIPRRDDIFYYFDPPYFKKGKLLYRNCYSEKDHVEISLKIRGLSCPWIVTYDNVEQIRNLYEGSSCAEFDISYSAHIKRSRGSEVMFYSGLNLPSNPYTRKKVSRTTSV